jgi:hypothetical protein
MTFPPIDLLWDERDREGRGSPVEAPPKFVVVAAVSFGTFVQAIQLGWLLFRLDRAFAESAVILTGFP